MKKIIYILIVIIGCLTSCEQLTIWQNEINKDISRPGSYINLQLKDSSVHFIFDNNDVLISIIEYTPEEAKKDTIILLDGVPDVNYKLVSYFNYNQYDFSNMIPGVTKCDQTQMKLAGTNEGETFEFIGSSNNIYHAYNEFKALWGDRNTVVVNPNNRVYNATVKILCEEGFDFWRDMTDFTIDFKNVPSTIQKDGSWTNNTCIYTIEEFTPEGPIAAVMCLPRFLDQHNVSMHAVQNGVSIGDIPVIPSKLGIDPNASGEVNFTIELYINPQKITVLINDWIVGVIQITELGGAS